jgi:glycosyltransferase involved in cell wall biosynthesis
MSTLNWVVLQIGRREHYAIPRMLHARRHLAGLFTDVWCPSGASWWLPERQRQRLGSRFHPELDRAAVHAPALVEWLVNEGLAAFKTRCHGPWAGIVHRNQWFQRKAVRWLENHQWTAEPRILFAYSYAALRPFEWARKRGWTTVLGQIDPGPAHFEVVTEVARRHDLPPPQLPTESYWQQWEMECRLADLIVVNSEWSRECLVSHGIESNKLAVIPLTYEAPGGLAPAKPPVPAAFSQQRPLRVLYTGKLAAAKGMPELFAAARELAEAPVEWLLAGPFEEAWITRELPGLPAVQWLGNLPGAAMPDLYEKADVLLLPTHSDGFALVQLEALAHGLPVIASRNSGRVVQSGHQGIVLQDVSAAAIVQAVRLLLARPDVLKHWTENARLPDAYQGFAVTQLWENLAAGLAPKAWV